MHFQYLKFRRRNVPFLKVETEGAKNGRSDHISWLLNVKMNCPVAFRYFKSILGRLSRSVKLGLLVSWLFSQSEKYYKRGGYSCHWACTSPDYYCPGDRSTGENLEWVSEGFSKVVTIALIGVRGLIFSVELPHREFVAPLMFLSHLLASEPGWANYRASGKT